MRYLLLALVLVGGCAEADDAIAPAPDLGTAHDGSHETGGDAGRVCDAAVETLSGTATYVTRSGAALDPTAQTGIAATPTCADWVASREGQHATQVTVINGKLGDTLTEEVISVEIAQGCMYRLRYTQFAASGSTQQPCAFTIDYTIVVP